MAHTAPGRVRLRGERRASVQASNIGEGVIMAWTVPPHGSPDYHALSVLARCLSGPRSALSQRLLALDSRLSSLQSGQLNLQSESLFVIDVLLMRGGDLSYVRRVLGWEIDRLHADVAGYCRLPRLRQSWVTAQRAARSSFMLRARHLSEFGVSLDEDIDRVEALSTSDFARAASYLSEDRIA